MASAKVETISVSKYTIELTEQEYENLISCIMYVKENSCSDHYEDISNALYRDLHEAIDNKTIF